MEGYTAAVRLRDAEGNFTTYFVVLEGGWIQCSHVPYHTRSAEDALKAAGGTEPVNGGTA